MLQDGFPLAAYKEQHAADRQAGRRASGPSSGILPGDLLEHGKDRSRFFDLNFDGRFDAGVAHPKAVDGFDFKQVFPAFCIGVQRPVEMVERRCYIFRHQRPIHEKARLRQRARVMIGKLDNDLDVRCQRLQAGFLLIAVFD